ncbi:MAG: Ig-like domain-containing protein [Lachnospiraceae bacterium]|nr:Ig-like domain-containing protein [Lachnospiraceae bacterium]
MGRESKKTRRLLIGIVIAVMALIIPVFVPTGGTAGIIRVRADEKKTEKQELNITKLSVKVGETASLFVRELEVGDKVTYKTSKKKVATVAATGIVTGKKKGSANITAQVKHVDGTTDSYKCKVTVSAAKKEATLKYKEIFTKDELAAALSSSDGGAFKLGLPIKGIDKGITVKGKVVLDLNGQGLLRGSAPYGLFQIVDGGELTITESGKTPTTVMSLSATGGVADCIDGTLIIEGGDFSSAGGRVFYSKGNMIINGGSVSGGSDCNVYVESGTVQINGGSLSGSKSAIYQKDGEVVINAGSLQSSRQCIYSAGGTTVVNGGELSVYEKASPKDPNPFAVAVSGGSVRINGGTIVYDEVGLIIDKGQIFINGGKIYSSQKGDSYAIHSKSAKGNTEITVNGGTLTAGYAALYLDTVTEGGVVVNGGTIESTGPVAITAVKCPLTVTGGKIKCEETICFVNNEKDQAVTFTGGSLSGGAGIVVSGSSDVDIKGVTFKTSNQGLVIGAYYDGKIKYDKDAVKNVLDQRTKEEKGSETAPANGYKRFDITYSKGMYVGDFDTLYSLFCVAYEQLIDEIEIITSKELFDAVFKNQGDLFRKYAGTCMGETTNIHGGYGTYSDGRTKCTIQFTFGWETQINSISFNKSAYKNADKDVQKYSDEIDKILDSIITKDMTDKEKVTAVHDYMCDHYAYADPIIEDETGLKSDHSFHAMLDDGTGVCQAYSSLFHVMMLKLGIDDTLVCGKGASNQWATDWEDHMWNCVVIDGTQYFVDVTWDDSLKCTDYLLKTGSEFYADGLHKQEEFWK